MNDAITIAIEFLANRASPLQTASKMLGVELTALPCWDGTGGANGPLSAFYLAADAADSCHFLGADVERWHPQVREQKREELKAAEDHWRGPVDYACRSLMEYAEAHI